MMDERKGEIIEGEREECHRVKEELQDQLTTSEGENNAARRRANKRCRRKRVTAECLRFQAGDLTTVEFTQAVFCL